MGEKKERVKTFIGRKNGVKIKKIKKNGISKIFSRGAQFGVGGKWDVETCPQRMKWGGVKMGEKPEKKWGQKQDFEI